MSPSIPSDAQAKPSLYSCNNPLDILYQRGKCSDYKLQTWDGKLGVQIIELFEQTGSLVQEL